MSDINFSSPNHPGGLQVIDHNKHGHGNGCRDSVHHHSTFCCNDELSAAEVSVMESARDNASDAEKAAWLSGRESVAATERHGLHVSDQVQDGFSRTNDNLCGATARTNDNMSHGFARTNDNLFMKFENLDMFLASNFKDSCVQALTMKADLAKQIAESMCDVKAIVRETANTTDTLIRATENQRIRDELARAQQEILTLKINIGPLVKA